MDRVAIFVDVGYLCTGGAAALEKRKCVRSEIRTDIEAVFRLLTQKNSSITGLPLLRVYWYDGSIGGRLTTEQTLAARRNEIKLRLGIVNGLGEQKEVDTKLVTDLAELARNKAISDAIVLGGDGDLRLGVEIAQQYGVRVHLLTIHSTGVSDPLKMEADTWNEISEDEIRTVLSVASPPVATTPASTRSVASTAPSRPLTFDPTSIVREYLTTLSEQDKNDLITAIKAGDGGIPSDHNGRLLGRSGGLMGRDLRKEIKIQLGLFP
jgi:uncharacterized LabA/DUF88 family protein